MASRVTRNINKKQDKTVINKLCANCRRKCKQPETAVISSCPRYYSIRRKKQVYKEWKQQELFPVEKRGRKKRTGN